MIKKNLMLISILIAVTFVIIILTSTVFAQTRTCSVGDMKTTLQKALFDYLPNPEESEFDDDEIKDLLDFYLESINLTNVRCDVRASLSNIDYDDIFDKFENFTTKITIPACSDGTPFGQCSQTPSKYCFAGKLIDREKCEIDEKLPQ